MPESSSAPLGGDRGFAAAGQRLLVTATGNAGKLGEIDAIIGYALRRQGVRLVRPSDIGCAGWQVDEDRATFAENALLKAASAARACGLPALADDSGLCVDALGGEPGVRSARWLGPGADDRARNDALLSQLSMVERREAAFVCAVALALPSGIALVKEGVCRGTIAREARGGAGFGYDPIFVPDGQRLTFAEMAPQAKNRVSHRTLALLGLAAMKDFNEMLPNG